MKTFAKIPLLVATLLIASFSTHALAAACEDTVVLLKKGKCTSSYGDHSCRAVGRAANDAPVELLYRASELALADLKVGEKTLIIRTDRMENPAQIRKMISEMERLDKKGKKCGLQLCMKIRNNEVALQSTNSDCKTLDNIKFEPFLGRFSF